MDAENPKPVKIQILPYMGAPKDDDNVKKPHPAALNTGGKTVRPTPMLDSSSRSGGYKAGGMVPPPRFSSGRMDPGRADVVTRGGRTVAAFEVDPDSSQKAADLASEMQREARGKAAGGMVRRGYGKARGA